MKFESGVELGHWIIFDDHYLKSNAFTITKTKELSSANKYTQDFLDGVIHKELISLELNILSKR